MAARCPGWLAIALLASAACGGPTKPKEPQPPNVSLSPVPREIIGTGFEMIDYNVYALCGDGDMMTHAAYGRRALSSR